MNKKEVTVKGTLKPQVVATIIEDILDSFKKGKVVVQNGHDFVTLQPSDQISIELEAIQKKGKEKLVLEISWEQRVEPTLPDEGFKISSEEPVVEEPEEEPDEEPVAEAAPEAPKTPVSVAPVATPGAKVEAAKPATPATKDEPKADDAKKPGPKGKK